MSRPLAIVRDHERADDVMASITIRVHRDGAMSVSGNIEDEAYALALVDAARDSVINHHKRGRDLSAGLILPAHDNPLSK